MVAVAVRDGCINLLSLEEWPVALLLVVAKCDKPNNHSNPVEVVREHAAEGCRILPSEERVENAPSTTAVELGVAALD
jgi:hypothetical protein